MQLSNMMQIINRVLILLLIILQLVFNQSQSNGYVEAMGAGMSVPVSYVTSSEARAVRFARLLIEVFDTVMPQLTPEEVKSRLDSARLHMLDPTIRRPHFEELYNMVRRVSFVHTNNSCSIDKLTHRVKLEQDYEWRHNVGPYMSHYNNIHLRNCITRYNNEIERELEENRDIYRQKPLRNLTRVSLITIPLQTAIDEAASSEDPILYWRILHRGIVQYMSQIGYDMEKPIDMRVHEKVEQVDQWLLETFYEECELITKIHGKHYEFYSLIHQYNAGLVHLLRPKVSSILYRMQICYVLSNYQKHIYPLGKFYDSTTLIGPLQSQGIDPSSSPMHPNEIEDLLDTTIMVLQAELVYGLFNEVLARELYDLFVISRIDVFHCQASVYMEAIANLKQIYWDKPNVKNYLDYFGRLQLIECLPGFESRLLYQTMGIKDEDQIMNIVDNLHKAFKEVASDYNERIKLYLDLPYPFYYRAINHFMKKNFNFDMQAQNTVQNVDIKLVIKGLKKLYRSCTRYTDRLDLSWNRFEMLRSLDIGQVSVFNPKSLDWMEKFNICEHVDLDPDSIYQLFRT